MPDEREDERDREAVAASKAWLDEAIRSGRVVDETEEVLRRGIGAFILVPAPRRADRKRVGRAGRARRSVGIDASLNSTSDGQA